MPVANQRPCKQISSDSHKHDTHLVNTKVKGPPDARNYAQISFHIQNGGTIKTHTLRWQLVYKNVLKMIKGFDKINGSRLHILSSNECSP